MSGWGTLRAQMGSSVYLDPKEPTFFRVPYYDFLI